MTFPPFQKLSARVADLPATQVLHEGVPPHMDMLVRTWIYRALAGGGAAMIALRLEIPIDYERADGDAARFLAFDPQPDELLDVVDAILSCGGPWPAPSTGDRVRSRNTNHAGLIELKNDLETLLREGSSAWRVNDSFSALTRRVDVTVTAAAQASEGTAMAVPAAGSAGGQLRAACDALYGLHPDPSAAYRDAIRAVESAAHATIEPNNAKATLGTMLGQFRNAPHVYRIAIPGPDGTGSITPLTAMMELLWTGQTSRHGGQAPTRPETFEEAQVAVHLAATLVQWFTSGAVTRR